ncbi:MAG: mannose-6-phosphate isomerase, partial [Crocosphaera sp.]
MVQAKENKKSEVATLPFSVAHTGITSTETRPWGSFTTLEEGPGYKIKRIEVNPGHRLSLQMHH